MIAKLNAEITVKDTVHYQINKVKKHKTLKNLKRSDLKRKTKPFNDRVLLREFKINHLLKLQSAPNILNLKSAREYSDDA